MRTLESNATKTVIVCWIAKTERLACTEPNFERHYLTVKMTFRSDIEFSIETITAEIAVARCGSLRATTTKCNDAQSVVLISKQHL